MLKICDSTTSKLPPSELAHCQVLKFDGGVAQQFFDAIVIGGGPGGSTTSTYLAMAGKRVLVLEKEHFPRFHIGESLLPYNIPLFREMGVLPALEAAGFPPKHGAQFELGNASKKLKLVFRNGCFTQEPRVFQVERARFDQILLQHAQKSGAEVREGWTVAKTSVTEEGAAIEARDEQGTTESFRGRFLIDASGRNNFTGNQEGLRVVHPHLKKLSLFGHFENVKLDDGPARGDTVIVRLADKWFWLIPVSATITSVGCVMDQEEFAAARQPPADLFTRLWQSSSAMRERMKNARLLTSVQTTTDFSYHNRRLTGRRLLRVGDAAGFMDPIFSAGVYLAMYSGRLAANMVVQSLAAGDDGASRFRTYEKRIFGAMRAYWKMVDGFYTTPFLEVFLEPRNNFQIPDAMVAVLAGELEGGWKLIWRRWLFFWLVRIQKYRAILPRISFDEDTSKNTRLTSDSTSLGVKPPQLERS